jgi:hypothetical protein
MVGATGSNQTAKARSTATALSFNASNNTLSASAISAADVITLTTKPFFRNVPTIASNYTVTTSYNEMSIGPITINNGITVTVDSGATWTVI